jgi:hypothetical protein
MGDPTSSYATAGIALGVSGALKPHHHDKVETPSVGTFNSLFIINLFFEKLSLNTPKIITDSLFSPRITFKMEFSLYERGEGHYRTLREGK